MDIEAVAWLGRYYRDRILSATHLRFYERTFDHPELTQAYEYMQRAVSDWDHLSDVTEEHFGFVPEYIRMGVKDFRWRDEGRSLGVDLDQLNNLETAFRRLPATGRTRCDHWPRAAREGRARETVSPDGNLSPHLSDDPHVYVFYRNSNEIGYTKLELKQDDEFARTWSVTIPGDQVVAGFSRLLLWSELGTMGRLRRDYCASSSLSRAGEQATTSSLYFPTLHLPRL